jgi:hypothetical protein
MRARTHTHTQATKAKGFVGYYQNVFADAAHPPTHPEQRDGLDGDASRAAARNLAKSRSVRARESRGATRLKGADALEEAKEILEHDTTRHDSFQVSVLLWGGGGGGCIIDVYVHVCITCVYMQHTQTRTHTHTHTHMYTRVCVCVCII